MSLSSGCGDWGSGPAAGVARRTLGASTFFYAPGYLCMVATEDAAAFVRSLGSPAADPQATALYRHGLEADAGLARSRAAELEPTCLTVFLDPRCNLSCVYCGHRPRPATAPVSPAAIEGAARLVAEGCRRTGRGMTAVFHGGGEPTVEPGRLEGVLAGVERIAEERGLSDKTDVPQAMHALCTRNLDAICQIEDNLTSATFPFIAQVAQKFKLPVFSFVNEQAHTGSSLVFAPNYFEAAREAASTISRIMHETSPELIPFKRINKFNLIVNTTFATAAGLTIPQSILSAADSVITTTH